MSDTRNNINDINEIDDDQLFDRFIVESERREGDIIDEHRSENGVEISGRINRNIELRRTIGDIIHTLEVELQRVQNRNDNPVINTTINNLNANGNRVDETPFSARRSYFSLFIRNLLVLDYFVMVFLFPFSFYNILRSGFSSITLSENDFLAEILVYLKYSRIVSENANPLMLLGYNDDGTMGLLGKFHNILVFYSSPIIKFILKLDFAKTFLIKTYEITVKFTIISFYLLYGFSGTIYLGLSSFFFIFCLALTIIRRYKNVQQMIITNLIFSASPAALEETHLEDSDNYGIFID